MRLIISNILIWIVASFVSTSAVFPPEMEKLMDKKSLPCDNYYQYACGKWLELQKDSITKVIWSMEKLEKNRRKVLDKVVKKDNKALRNLWNSCLSVPYKSRRGEISGIEPLIEDLKRISRTDTFRDIIELTGEFSRTRINAFIEFSVQPGGETYKKYALYLRPARLTLPDHAYRDMKPSHSHDPHYKYIEKLIEVSFKNERHLSGELYVKDTAEKVIKMEKKLREIKGQNLGNTKLLLRGDVARLWPNTIGAFLNGMGQQTFSHVQKIYIEDPEYFDSLEKEIKTFSMIDLKPYLAFVLIHNRAPSLGGDFVRVWNENIRSTTEIVDRREFCQDRIVELMPGVVGNYYTEIGLDSTRRTRAKDMVELVRNGMKSHILKSTWMSTEEIDEATKKLDKMLTMVAVPEYRSSVPENLSRDNYYTNVQKILEHWFERQMIRIGDYVLRETWPQSAAVVDATYDPHMNSVLFPSAMLQSPLLEAGSVHPARDFGAMGMIMGREVSRGFDKIGSEFGRLGNKRNWWSEATKLKFNQATLCLIEGHGRNADAVETINQNIADIRGIALAWEAYKKYMESQNTQRLSGNSRVTPSEGEKLFFLAFAQSMCTHIPRDLPSGSGEYALPEWRVNGALMNLDQFQIVYGCKAPQNMVPKLKCNLW